MRWMKSKIKAFENINIANGSIIFIKVSTLAPRQMITTLECKNKQEKKEGEKGLMICRMCQNKIEWNVVSLRFDRLALWFRTTMSRDVSTGPLARSFAYLLAPLTDSLAPHCLLRWRASLACFAALIRSLARSLTHSVRGKVNG